MENNKYPFPTLSIFYYYSNGGSRFIHLFIWAVKNAHDSSGLEGISFSGHGNWSSGKISDFLQGKVSTVSRLDQAFDDKFWDDSATATSYMCFNNTHFVDLAVVNGFIPMVYSYKCPVAFMRNWVELHYLIIVEIIALHKGAIMHGFWTL